MLMRRWRKRILPCAALLEGEYGIKGFFIGVPAQIGAGGVEKVLELDLDAAEKAELGKSFASVKKTIERQRALAQKAAQQQPATFPILAPEEKALAKSLDDFRSQHPRAFNKSQEEIDAAEQRVVELVSDVNEDWTLETRTSR